MSTELRATYRLQIHADFDLTKAAELIDYLHDLGISHLYTSPLFQATPGSTHGYDIVDPCRINEEVGGMRALDRLTEALLNVGMGHVLDIVPNHMAISGAENPWWWDVLENGPSSPYATYFDVEWDSPEARYENQVLVPVLGDHYGRVLENGEIRLDFDGEHFTIRYYENTYPVDPRSLHLVIRSAAEDLNSDTLSFFAGAYRRLPLATASDRASARRRNRDQAVLGSLLQRLCLERPSLRGAIERAIQHINNDPDRLDELISEQNYRLAFWRITGGELGYRRFFDINTLIGLRMEDEQVYNETHELILDLLKADHLDGLRIDHPDGLRDPTEYFQRLANAEGNGWIVVEKILEHGEALPKNWPVAGTTGYDFMNRANGIFVDPAAEETITDFYTRFTGESVDYDEMVREKKHLVIRDLLGSDVSRLTNLFRAICDRHRRHRDYTRLELQEALTEVAACMPVYRTYVRPDQDEILERDRVYLDEAIEAAKGHRIDLSPDLFDFFRDLLLLKVRGDLETELVMRFQQFTGPAMAKGVEDTTFYVFNRFVSLNEVGGHPKHFGHSVADFHEQTAQIGREWPHSMLSTSTHDTKRSEDVRARLNVLSEIPERWAAAVERWAAHNEQYKQEDLPDRNAEYLLYQNIVGAWPIEEERMLGYMEKAMREAKVYTSWTNQNPDYETKVNDFVCAIYADEEFTRDLATLVDEITEPGWINSLAQTLIKLTAPGIPDIYQGCELWDFSLVDPDNRRPVDYTQRRALLEEVSVLAPEAIWDRAEEGLPKLWVVRQTLDLRRRRPELFRAESSYRPVEVDLPNLVAYCRGEELMVMVPRLTLRHGRNWDGARIQIPTGQWRNLFTDETIEGGSQEISALLARFPVCLLAKEIR
jgi:(1->4)-alpha-D-glucan 1-alpha-D-glucosylmutase